MDLKPPLKIEQQICKLESHGMRIPDKDVARRFLASVNYYRWSGYALEYRQAAHSSDYAIDTSFEDIVEIYRFDEGLRHTLRKYLEIVEVYYKTQIAYTFSLTKCTQPPYDQHYLPSSYYRTDKFKLLLKHISAEESYFQDMAFVKHHIAVYDHKMPLWVLVETMTFSTLSMLYGCMYKSDQELIANGIGTSARILKNNLQGMAILRNKCAHGNRLYNNPMSLPVSFSPKFLRKNKHIETNTIFAYIVMLSKRLPDDVSRGELRRDMHNLILQ